jgi:ABC-type glycerol-3-phosphate transport system substrate-binding protein
MGGMRMRQVRIILGVLVTAVLLIGCGGEAAPETTSAAAVSASMKGTDLYSWQDEVGTWWFAILPGTNRLKTIDELQAAAVNVRDVKGAFSSLPPGETLLWNNQAAVEENVRELLAMPPGEIVATLRAHAASAQVELEVVPAAQ